MSEIVSSILSTRAKFLWSGVTALLESSQDPAAKEAQWTTKLYSHPLIQAFLPLDVQGKEALLGPKGAGPAYIPPQSFALALLDITGVNNDQVNEWQRRLQMRLAAVTGGDAATAATVKGLVEGLTAEIAGALDGAKLKSDLQEVAERLANVPVGEDEAKWNAGPRLTEIAGQIRGEALAFVQQPLLSLAKNPNVPALQKIAALVPAAGLESASVRNALLVFLRQLPADPTALTLARAFAQNISANYARQALAQLDNPDLQKALLGLLDQSQGDMEKLQAAVETWFNQSMDRVQGWYKRWTMTVHMILATVLTVFMNVDTLVVLRHLTADQALRQVLVAQAESFPKKSPRPENAPADALAKADSGRLTIPATATSSDASATNDVVKAAVKAGDLRSELLDLGLPLGWDPPAQGRTSKDASSVSTSGPVEEYRTQPNWSQLFSGDKDTWDAWSDAGRTVRFHLFGWILTIFAASLGAPFWFDLLNKFMNIRGSGSRPEPVGGKEKSN